MQKNIQKYRCRKIYTKTWRMPKIWRMQKTWRPKNQWRLVKCWRLLKCQRPWKCWRSRKGRRTRCITPYCLGSAEFPTADFSLVPLMSTFSSLLMLNRVHVDSKWGMVPQRPAFMGGLSSHTVPARHSQRWSNLWRRPNTWRPPGFSLFSPYNKCTLQKLVLLLDLSTLHKPVLTWCTWTCMDNRSLCWSRHVYTTCGWAALRHAPQGPELHIDNVWTAGAFAAPWCVYIFQGSELYLNVKKETTLLEPVWLLDLSTLQRPVLTCQCLH